jgi:hypothetical protein
MTSTESPVISYQEFLIQCNQVILRGDIAVLPVGVIYSMGRIDNPFCAGSDIQIYLSVELYELGIYRHKNHKIPRYFFEFWDTEFR